jgi:hypothetical protein
VQLKSPAAAVAAYSSGISLSPLNLIKLSVCAGSDCDKIGSRDCSGCLKESYCSEKCQKKDWKAHKSLCTMIQMMPVAKETFKRIDFVVQKVKNLTAAEKAKIGLNKYVRLLEHAAAYAEVYIYMYMYIYI